MFFKGRTWLWLYITTGFVLGSELHGPEQRGGNNCFQLNSFRCSFEGAERYCHAQGGHLAFTWNQEVQDLLWDFLEKEKWWVGGNLTLPRKHQEKNHPGEALGFTFQLPRPQHLHCDHTPAHTTVISHLSCASATSWPLPARSQPSSARSPSEQNWITPLLLEPVVTGLTPVLSSPPPPGPPRSSKPASCGLRTFAPLSCPSPVHWQSFLSPLHSTSKTLCHHLSPFPSVPPEVTPQGVSVTPAPTSKPLPLTPELPGPGSVTHAGKALEEITSSPKEDSHPSVFTSHPQVPFQNAPDQVKPRFKAVINSTEMCMCLLKFQVRVINTLTDLNEQLLQSPLLNSNNPGSRTPVTVCLFHSLNNVMKAGEASRPRHGHSVEQVENMLKMSLLSLGRIQETFLQQNRCAEPEVTLTSSTAALMLSRQNISTLPLSSYTLGDPAPVRLGFPSASALEELLKKHPGVDVQVTGLAFNPFRDFDKKKIVGSVGSVLLSSNHKLLQVHDLMEDIEIMLWRNASMETHPTSLNMSTDHFTITVNVTSLEKSLIVCVEPEGPLSLTLYLGFQHQPNHTHFRLPKERVSQKDEEYTWVLRPEKLRYGVGTYYITAVLDKSKEGARQTPTLLSVVTAVTQCYFWDSLNSMWKSSGCQVGLQSTLVRTQCLCNHLTYFGSDFFLVPRMVNVEDVAELFLRVTSNPVGVSLLASLVGIYMLIFVWAWRKDQADAQKVKVTILADNDPSSQFHYLIAVSTGYRRRAATTASVVITLYGSEGRSQPHHLCDSQKAVFERGGLDVFLLGTPSSLGELHSLRLWHDNSGASPAWYVSQVTVADIAGKRKWHFLCNCWLAVNLGDCERDRVFMPVSKRELFSFRHLFSSMIIEKFTQDCLWLSVATRHPWNEFTRVQRLTCYMTLLLCNMVINVMFWKVNSTTTKRDEQARVGPFAVTWSELLVSIQTAVIFFPISLVIGRLFPLIQPQEPLPVFPPIQASCPSDASSEPLSLTEVVEELKETVGFLLRRNMYLLSECEPSSWHSDSINELLKLLSGLVCSYLEHPGCPQQAGPYWANVVPENHHHFCSYLLRVLQRLQSHLQTLGPTQADHPSDFLDAVHQLQKLQELLETHVLPTEEATSFPILSPEEGKQRLSKGWHRWLTYFCWLLLGVTSLASAFFTALYSLELNKDQATSWVISMILSLLQNTFISQPAKVIFLTLFYSLMLNRLPQLHKEKEHQTRRILALWARCPSSLPGSRDKNNSIYVAPTMNTPVKRPERALKEKKFFKLTGDVLAQILFLTLLMTTVYSTQNSNRFYLRQAIHKSFSHRFSEIKLLKHFYTWANSTLLPNLYGDYRGFITDGNSFLLGNVLLRQIRVPCATFFSSRLSLQEQLKPSRQVQEDTENYGVNWGPPDKNSTKLDRIWHYQNQEALGGYPIQGEFATYSGGGYVVRLGRNSSNARRVLQQLEQSHWLDHCTKSLFVEFVVFNANVNLFCVVTLILESNNVGAFFTSMRLDILTSLQISKNFAWSVMSQVSYYLLVCYYAFAQGRQLKQQRWRFFMRKRNLLDMSIILLSFVILGLDLTVISLHKKHMVQYHYDRDRFINFYEAVKVNSAVIHLMGFLVLLATVQLWSLLYQNPRLQVIDRTLSKAWDEVVGFLLVILILLTGYAIAFNLLFGWSISDYQTFLSSAVTVVSFLMGISHHEEVTAVNPVLGSFLIFTYVVLMVLMIINLFVSAILMAFGKERKSLKVSATLMDMLLLKLSSLLGIQQHQSTCEHTALTATATDK
uniref:Polycystin 1 like 3, transient receptor potential channel interacting n=1 Tax=Ovis aries TaxID=9940 RepID=A0AC11BMR0_SHEEP